MGKDGTVQSSSPQRLHKKSVSVHTTPLAQAGGGGGGGTIDLLICSLTMDSCPNLSGTEDKSFNFLLGFNHPLILLMRRISQHTMEIIISLEVCKFRPCKRMSQQRF